MENTTNPLQLVSEIKERRRRDGAPDAQACLAHYPAIRQRKSLALELAYEEYCQREEAGEAVSAERFCVRFPSISHSLRRQIEVHQYLESNPEMLAAAAAMYWPEAGQMFGEFRILEQLGRGGLARVYLGSQPSIGDRQIVMKIAYQGAYEADTLGRLKHPHIVPVYSVLKDEQTGMSGICMPFCGRSTLCDVLDVAFAGPRPPARASVILQAAVQRQDAQDRYERIGQPSRLMASASYVSGIVELGQQLADALHHAHQQDILHGDLKPSNILITPGGSAMLLDFNLSHDSRHPAAATGGTLPYMAPEQIRSAVLAYQDGAGQVDQRSDVYSLATILYELLCGQLPYGPVPEPIADRQVASQRLALQQHPPPLLTTRSRAIDSRLAALINECLAFEPASRPPSMDILADRLRGQLDPSRRAARWARLHRRAVLAAGLGTSLAGASGLAFALTRDPYPLRQYTQGLVLYRDGQFAAAAEYFSRAADADGNSIPSLYALGRTYIQLGEQSATTSARSRQDFFLRAMETFQSLRPLRRRAG